ncbi:MAG: hypothetical protein ACI9MR_001137, partial [Myxococcota bacterium]
MKPTTTGSIPPRNSWAGAGTHLGCARYDKRTVFAVLPWLLLVAAVLINGPATANHLFQQQPDSPNLPEIIEPGLVHSFDVIEVALRPTTASTGAMNVVVFGTGWTSDDRMRFSVLNPSADLGRTSVQFGPGGLSVNFAIGSAEWNALTALIDSGTESGTTFYRGPDQITPIIDGPVVEFEMTSGSFTPTGFAVQYQTGTPSPSPTGDSGWYDFGGGNTRFVKSAPLSDCGNSVIEGDEQCDDGNLQGGDCCGATCQLESVGAFCGASGSGVCDLQDICDGAGACVDAIADTMTLCRPAAGVCDEPEFCGGDGLCTSDFKRTNECRASAGVCDPAESCDGVLDSCPTDGKSTAECRPVAAQCDVAESCDGVGAGCPADDAVTDTTPCDDSDACTSDDACAAGACASGAPVDCDDNDVCTAERCESIGGCQTVPICDCAGCTESHGYWKNNGDWPVTELSLGGAVRDEATLREWLSVPKRGSASQILAAQAVAAALNVAAGADDCSVADALEEADALLVMYPVSAQRKKSKKKSRRAGHDEMTALAAELEDWNIGQMGPGHCGDGDYDYRDGAPTCDADGQCDQALLVCDQDDDVCTTTACSSEEQACVDANNDGPCGMRTGGDGPEQEGTAILQSSMGSVLSHQTVFANTYVSAGAGSPGHETVYGNILANTYVTMGAGSQVTGGIQTGTDLTTGASATVDGSALAVGSSTLGAYS